MSLLLRITTPTACGGLVFENGVVTATAPFLEDLLGTTESEARAHCEVRDWTVETLPREKVDDAVPPFPPGSPGNRLALRLEEMLWPERFPPGHVRHDPEHVYWDGCDDYGPDNDDWVEPHQWSADTIFWVSELVTRELGGPPKAARISAVEEDGC